MSDYERDAIAAQYTGAAQAAQCIGANRNVTLGAQAPGMQARPLDRLTNAAERIAEAAKSINQFHERFGSPHGAQTLSGAKTEAPDRNGHIGSIDELFKQLAWLETECARLNLIG